MNGLIEGAGYKYLGIIQADQIRYTEMKENGKTEYLRRAHKVLGTNLNGGNIIKGINIWAVSAYGGTLQHSLTEIIQN